MSKSNMWMVIILLSVPLLTTAKPTPDPDPFFLLEKPHDVNMPDYIGCHIIQAATFGYGWPYYGPSVHYTYYPWYYPFRYYLA